MAFPQLPGGPIYALITLALIGSVLGLQPVRATTIQVPLDQPTIQAGVDAASPGDSVLVRCGYYLERNITVRPGITLLSEGGYAGCVLIDAQDMGRVLNLLAGGDLETRIEGLTVHNGRSGFLCAASSATIVNCTFSSHASSQAFPGYAVQLSESRATFKNCVFVENQGALEASSCPSIDLEDCAFFRSRSRFGVVSVLSTPTTLTRCVFADNTPGAVQVFDCPSLDIGSCTFYGNASTVLRLDNTPATVDNSIIAFNGEPVACSGSAQVELRCCDVFGNQAGDWVGCFAGQGDQNGNLSLDPLFCEPRFLDFTVRESSPCAAANAPPGCGLIGALPVGCGPQAIDPTTWGHVKAIFR